VQKDSILFGALMGVVVPIISFGLWSSANKLLGTLGITDALGQPFQFSERLIFLLSISMNIFVFRYFSRRYWEDAMRGTIFPTMLFVAVWVYRYHLT
jgi:hypothetical protein